MLWNDISKLQTRVNPMTPTLQIIELIWIWIKRRNYLNLIKSINLIDLEFYFPPNPRITLSWENLTWGGLEL